LQNKFSSAKGTQMVKEKVNYFGWFFIILFIIILVLYL
jgi:hypothetical protein